MLLDGSIEIFIQYQASTIYYINLNEQGKKPLLDVQLVSGFLDASSLFFTELGLGKESNLFRVLRGDSEMRMLLGDRIHGTLLLRGLTDLDRIAYMQLDEMLASIIQQFEDKYMNEIEEFILHGKFKFDGIQEFVLNAVQKIKAHMYSSYLMKILGTAINRNVKKKPCLRLLIQINYLFAYLNLDFFTIYADLDSMWQILQDFQKKHITFARIIRSVNKNTIKTWELFKIPLIPDLIDSTKKTPVKKLKRIKKTKKTKKAKNR
jgi:hypothetical protein